MSTPINIKYKFHAFNSEIMLPSRFLHFASISVRLPVSFHRGTIPKLLTIRP